MSVATLQDVSDIKARLAERDAEQAKTATERAEAVCPYVRHPLRVVDSYIDCVRNPEGRVMLGVREIDLMMRGIGRGELAFVFGQMHQGKTQLVLNSVVHNHDKRILFFTPDEMAEEVFTKLVAIKHGIDVETLEEAVKSGDEDMVKLLRRAATIDFPNLAIVDEGMGLKKLNEVRLQQEQVWGGECDLLVIDYLGSIPGYQDEGPAAKAVKALAKNERQRVLCIHQGQQDSLSRGKFKGPHGMRYGGHNEATFMIEVCRPADEYGISEHERVANQDVLAWRLWKNKRPPCKTGRGKLFLHPKTGRTDSWAAEHLVASGGPTTDPVVAIRASNVRQLR